MKQIFRTTFRYWATQEGFGFCLVLVGVVFFLLLKSYWLSSLCLVMAAFGLKAILKLRQSRIEIDENEIVSVNNQEEIRIAWANIFAVEFLQGARAAKFLEFWTKEKVVSIQIQQFDYNYILQLVKNFIPPAALKENAIFSSPPYQKLMAEMREKVAGLDRELQVTDYWLIKAVGWALLIFCIPACLLLVIHEMVIALLPLFFAILGAIFIANTGSLKVDREKLIRKTLLGRYQMRWDEVRWIEHHEQDSGWLLCGENKQLGIMAPQWCSGEDRELYTALLHTVMYERGITMKRTLKVLVKWSKNTKIYS